MATASPADRRGGRGVADAGDAVARADPGHGHDHQHVRGRDRRDVDPHALRALQVDPALASSVFITTLTDVFGFLSFLGLGALFITTCVSRDRDKIRGNAEC